MVLSEQPGSGRVCHAEVMRREAVNARVAQGLKGQRTFVQESRKSHSQCDVPLAGSGRMGGPGTSRGGKGKGSSSGIGVARGS